MERLRAQAVPCDCGAKSAPRGLLRFGLLDRRPDGIGRRRHGYVADAELAQGIEDGADHDGGRRRGAALAAGLDAERVGRRQHLGDFGLERPTIRMPSIGTYRADQPGQCDPLGWFDLHEPRADESLQGDGAF